MRAIKTSALPCPAYTVMVVVDLVRLFVIPQRAEGHIAPPVILRQHCTEESQRLHCQRSTFRAGCRFRAQLMFQWYSFGLCDLLCCASFGFLYCVRCVHSLTVHGVRLHRCDDACCCMRCSQAVPQRYFGWMFSQQHTQRRQIKKPCLVIFAISDVDSWNIKSLQKGPGQQKPKAYRATTKSRQVH
jgi:hypothetical protein